MSLFSPLWYRIAELRPRLARDVAAREQLTRGARWHVLFHAVNGRQCRINERAYQVIGRLDGRHTVQQIWDVVLETLQDDAPAQGEVLQLLGQLAEQGFVDMGGTVDIPAQALRREQRRRRRRRSHVNPFAFRVPLGDPGALLRALAPLTTRIVRPWGGAAWIVLLVLGALTAALHWPALSAQFALQMATPYYLLLAWILFPFIKAVHELAHAVAVRHFGGEVHEAGVTLFVLTPAPYVDASDSARFQRRFERGAVAAAGIVTELGVAAVAVLLWASVEPGLVRDLAFVAAFIAGVSTVLFNANPLLRFDGYYILCDLFDLPNLATRSSRYWRERLGRWIGAAPRTDALAAMPGEAKWLAFYAPASWLYRIVLSVFIVTWIGQFSVVLGVGAAIFAAATVIVLPIASTLRALLASSTGTERHWRTRLGIAGATAAAFVLALVLPLPFHTTALGVVWLPDQAHARAETDGFVARFEVADGQPVVPGQLLATLEDPELIAQRTRLQAQLDALEAERFDSLAGDSLRASNTQESIDRVGAELARVSERIAKLEIRARIAGVAVMPRQQDMIDSFVRRGTTLGYVLDRREILVRAAVPQRDAALLRERHRSAEVRLADALADALPAALVRDVPAAVYELPSRALGDRGGGPYVTDPGDPDGLRTLDPVVHIDLALSERVLDYVGGRVWVRFDHGTAPLVQQSYRRLRQLFLQYFNPAV